MMQLGLMDAVPGQRDWLHKVAETQVVLEGVRVGEVL